MRLTLDDRQFAEVFVQGDEDSLVPVGTFEDLLVAWIFSPIRRRHDIVTLIGEIFTDTSPDATVQEDPHPSVPVGMRKGSTRSCPTKRRAYSRQAWTSSSSNQG